MQFSVKKERLILGEVWKIDHLKSRIGIFKGGEGGEIEKTRS